MRQDRTSKTSIKARRKLAGWDIEYLLTFLAHQNAVVLRFRTTHWGWPRTRDKPINPTLSTVTGTIGR